MTVKTIRDIVHWTAEFHEHLSTCMQSCLDKNSSERAQMVLNYLSIHEMRLAKVVKRFEETGKRNVLDTWVYEHIQTHPIVSEAFCDAPDAGKNLDQIVDMVLAQHEQIMGLYQSLETETEAPSVREFIKRLSDLLHQETGLIVQAINRFSDM